MDIHYTETAYGFEYGAVSITRMISDKEKGCVTLGLSTPKQYLQIRVTKAGKVRIFGKNNKEWVESE